MSQQQSTILNGPSGELTMAFREPQTQDDNMIKQQNFQQYQQQQVPQQRPPLQRVDSRAGLPQRPPFINQQGGQFRPGPVLQRPQFIPNQQQQQQQQQPQQPFLQKQPSIQRPPPPNQARPNLPPRPYPPRPQPPQQQPYQQPQQPRPPPPRFQSPPQQVSFEDQPYRPQNLDPNDDRQPPNDKLLTSKEQKVSLNKEKDEEDEEEEERLTTKPPTPPNTLQLSADKISSSPSPQPETVIEVKGKTHDGNYQNAASTDKFDKSKREVNDNKNEVVGNHAKREGDNDSGVDESTQGNENTSNGDSHGRKSSRNTSRLTTPTKNRSFSRGSKSPHLKSPDSIPGTPSSADRKKVPMNKIQVGSAPSPNLKVVKSKIGSLGNTSHRPGGGNVKIEHKKIDLSNTTSKIGAKNENYVPSGGEKKIVSVKLQWNAKSKVGSLDNATHKPKGGDKKIESVKLDFKDKAKPKVGSKDNLKHVPGGGDVKSEPEDLKIEEGKKEAIENKKLNIKGESKVGSLHNVKHKPGGGDKKIFDDKEYLRQKTGLSNENNSITGSQDSLPSQPSDAREPLSDENLNRERLTTNE